MQGIGIDSGDCHVRLRNNVRDSCMRFDSRRYIPCNVIEQHVTRDTVETILEAETERDDLVDFVLNGAIRVFLILVNSARDASQLVLFLGESKQRGLVDSSLPVKLDRDDGFCNVFELHQDQFLAPVFDKHNLHFRLNTSTPLPFLRKYQMCLSDEFDVLCIDAHPAHFPTLACEGSNASSVNITVIKSHIEQVGFFKDLVRMFNQRTTNPQSLRSPVLPLGSYEYVDDLHSYLIFPSKYRGTAYDYLKAFPCPSAEGALQRIIGQFTDLCSTLSVFHEAGLTHGGLALQTIVWTKGNDNTDALLIVHLAPIGRAMDTDARGRHKPTPPFEDPEAVDPAGGNADELEDPTPAGEMWDIGCILLCVLMHLVNDTRNFTTLAEMSPRLWEELDPFLYAQLQGQRRYRVNQAVKTHMEELYPILEEYPAHRDLLELVHNKILVIPATSESHGGKRGRATAEEVYRRLEEIRINCERDPSYSRSVQAKITLPSISEHERHRRLPPPSDHVPRVPSRSADLRKWETGITDNALNSILETRFASRLFRLIHWDEVKPTAEKGQNPLCHRCSAIKTAQLFDPAFDLSTLQSGCPLCELLSDALAYTHGLPLR